MGGEVDDVAQRQKSWWSNRLVLPGIDLREHPKFDTKEKIESRPTTLWLRKRQLEDAILSERLPSQGGFHRRGTSGRSALRLRSCRARLAGAQLQGASLSWRAAAGRVARRGAAAGRVAHRRAAAGRVAHWRSCRARARAAQLQGASLAGAQLQGAWLDGAQLQGASLTGARAAAGRVAHGAQLQGASLWTIVWRVTATVSTPPTLMSIRPKPSAKYRSLDCRSARDLATGRLRPTPRYGG